MSDLAETIHAKMGSRLRANGSLPAARSDTALPADDDSVLPRYEVVRNACPIWRARIDGGGVGDLTGPDCSQLHMQVEELASANQRKDDFLAMLSHELRGPLSALHCAVRVLSGQAPETPARQKLLALSERQLGRMTKLVDDLLDVSRITSGRLRLQHERVDLRVVLDNALETLESDIKQRGHHVAIALPDAPVWLRADPDRLEQVFVNLLANATKYTNAGGELTVRVHTSVGEAVVQIRDSGIGIAPDVLPHIFDLFRQANEADPRSRSGLGVGLAVVRNLVELHGGSVTGTSAGHGKGSEFTVRLPMEG